MDSDRCHSNQKIYIRSYEKIMGSIVLETRDLSKQYKTQLALNHVNLRLQQGRIYGLIGKNGAGKTTLMLSLIHI